MQQSNLLLNKDACFNTVPAREYKISIIQNQRKIGATAYVTRDAIIVRCHDSLFRSSHMANSSLEIPLSEIDDIKYDSGYLMVYAKQYNVVQITGRDAWKLFSEVIQYFD